MTAETVLSPSAGSAAAPPPGSAPGRGERHAGPSLSPSRAADFKTCPLLFRFRTIDRLPEKPTPDQVRGTLVHAVLESLFDLPAAERTPAAAAALVAPSWARLVEREPALEALFAETVTIPAAGPSAVPTAAGAVPDPVATPSPAAPDSVSVPDPGAPGLVTPDPAALDPVSVPGPGAPDPAAPGLAATGPVSVPDPAAPGLAAPGSISASISAPDPGAPGPVSVPGPVAAPVAAGFSAGATVGAVGAGPTTTSAASTAAAVAGAAGPVGGGRPSTAAEALPGLEAAGEAERIAAFLAGAGDLLAGYFAVEDPQRLEPAERESLVSTLVDDELLIRGYIDRLDISPAGDLRVVDYKTGGAPREAFEGRALFQLKFYALVLWRTRGVVPRVLRLLYLKDAEICDYSPDAAELERFERTLVALSQAIERAKQDRDFRPKPSKLCGWCSHQQFCPEFGGTPPPYPEPQPEAASPNETQKDDTIATPVPRQP